MRHRLASLVAVILLALAPGGEALRVIVAAQVAGCACKIKSACCNGSFCAMEASPQCSSELSFDSCGQQSSQTAMPRFWRWTAVLSDPLVPAVDRSAREQHAAPRAATASGFLHPPDRPPRPTFS